MPVDKRVWVATRAFTRDSHKNAFPRRGRNACHKPRLCYIHEGLHHANSDFKGLNDFSDIFWAIDKQNLCLIFVMFKINILICDKSEFQIKVY